MMQDATCGIGSVSHDRMGTDSTNLQCMHVFSTQEMKPPYRYVSKGCMDAMGYMPTGPLIHGISWGAHGGPQPFKIEGKLRQWGLCPVTTPISIDAP